MLRDPASPNTPKSLYLGKRGNTPRVQILRGTCAIHAAIRPRAHHAGNRSSTPRGSCNLCKHRCGTGQGSGTLPCITSHHITSPLPFPRLQLGIPHGRWWPVGAQTAATCAPRRPAPPGRGRLRRVTLTLTLTLTLTGQCTHIHTVTPYMQHSH